MEQERLEQEAEVNDRKKKDWAVGIKDSGKDLTKELSATEMYRKYTMDCIEGGREAAAEADEEARKVHKDEMKRKETEWFEEKTREEAEAKAKKEADELRRLHNLAMFENEEARAKAVRIAAQKARLASQSEKTRLANQRKMRCSRNAKEQAKRKEDDSKTNKKRQDKTDFWKWRRERLNHHAECNERKANAVADVIEAWHQRLFALLPVHPFLSCCRFKSVSLVPSPCHDPT